MPLSRVFSLSERRYRETLKTKNRMVHKRIRMPPMAAVVTTLEWNEPGLSITTGPQDDDGDGVEIGVELVMTI